MIALRAFLGAYGMQLGIAAAILLGLWYVDHRGYKRAEEHYQLQEAKRVEMEAHLAAKIHGELQDGLTAIDRDTTGKLASIDRTERTVVQPIITREIAHDPRYSSADCSVSGVVLGAVNAARAASGDSAAQR